MFFSDKKNVFFDFFFFWRVLREVAQRPSAPMDEHAVVRFIYTEEYIAQSATKRKRNWPPVEVGQSFDFVEEESQFMIRVNRTTGGLRCKTENCPNRDFGTAHTSAAANCLRHLMVHKKRRTSNSQRRSLVLV